MTQTKRFVAVLLALMFLFSTGATLLAFAAETEKVLKGDVNASGDIDMMDYILTKRAYFGTFKFTEEQNEIADINGKDGLDMMDYVLIKRMYFGTFTLEDPYMPSDPIDPEGPAASGDEEPGTTPDPENPGTTPEQPSASDDEVTPEQPGTDPEQPGTDPENPGTDPENPGTDPEPPVVKINPSAFAYGWNLDNWNGTGGSNESYVFTEDYSDVIANYGWWSHIAFAPVEGEANTFKVAEISKCDGNAALTTALAIPEGGFVWATYLWPAEGSNAAANNAKIAFMTTGTKVVLSGVDFVAGTQAADASITVEEFTLGNNILKDKAYTNSPLFTWTEWNYDPDGEVAYPDTNGVEMTDGIFTPTNNIYDSQWAGFHSGTNYYTEKSYNYINVDLEAEYTLTNATMYVGAFGFGGGIAAPYYVEVYTSLDGEEYTLAGSYENPNVQNPVYYEVLSVDLNNVDAKYIEFRFKSYGWAFVGEVGAYGVLVSDDSSDDNTGDQPSASDDEAVPATPVVLSQGASYTCPAPNYYKWDSATQSNSDELHEAYIDDGIRLTDGKKAYEWYGTERYSVWAGGAMEIVVDLGAVKSTCAYKLYAVQAPNGVAAPNGITIYVSEDGTTWSESAVATGLKADAAVTDLSATVAQGVALYEYTATATGAVNARYVKFVIDTPTFTWTDEVEVLGYAE